MKKIGIVCDNYKLAMFRDKLTKAGFAYTEAAFVQAKTTSGSMTSMFIESKEENIPKIKTICEEIEEHFRGMKN